MTKRIFWAGDSTVKHNGIDTYPQTGIGQAFYLYARPEIIICNHAENGRSSKSFIEEGRLEEINQYIGEEDFLFIQFGHNDEKEDEERHTDPFTSYIDNLKKYIEVARDHNAYPVLITPLYRRLFTNGGILEEKVHLSYPAAMIALADEMNIPCVDLCELSRQLLLETGDEQSLKWFMNLKQGEFDNYPEGLEDNTHLRVEGAIVMAGLVAEELKALGGIYSRLVLDEV